jgi:hypothetical protein
MIRIDMALPLAWTSRRASTGRVGRCFVRPRRGVKEIFETRKHYSAQRNPRVARLQA